MTVQLADGAEMAGFRVEALLGRGGMASVYLAHDLRLGRKVALKVLSPELAESSQFQLRFHRESRLLASLDHPNIVPIYQAGEVAGVLYIAMRYVEGSDLGAVLEREGRLSPRVGLHVLTQVAAALHAAHQAGLVHRDVKPDNVLVTGGDASGHVYLTDFGLTKQLSSLSNLTVVGNVMGTMQYLAPEQISGKPVDARTDIYALGGLAFRCLTGQPPFRHQDNAALLWAHLSEAPPPPSECCPDLSEAVDEVIWTAMAKQPDDRFSSADEFAAALAEAVESTPVSTHGTSATGHISPGPAEPAYQMERTPSSPLIINAPPPGQDGAAPARDPAGRGRPRWLVPLAGVLVLGLIALAAVLLSGGGGSSNNGTKLSRHYSADNLVPYNVDLPSSWATAGSGNRMLFSPRASQLLPLFTTAGSPASWTTTWQEVQRNPSATVGLYTFFSLTAYDAAVPASEVLQSLLPANASFGQQNERTLGGTPTQVVDGDLTNPANAGQRLHFRCYVVERTTGLARAVTLLFLAPPDKFSANQAVFDKVAASVQFP